MRGDFGVEIKGVSGGGLFNFGENLLSTDVILGVDVHLGAALFPLSNWPPRHVVAFRCCSLAAISVL